MSIIQTEYSQDELQKLLGFTADSDTDTRQYYLSNKKVALPYGNYCKGKGQVYEVFLNIRNLSLRN